MASDNRAPSMAGTCARHVVGILFALSLTLNNRAVGYKEVSCAITLEGANCIGPALRLKGQSIGFVGVEVYSSLRPRLRTDKRRCEAY
ncbi:unnamed protein product [Miscanthus lutarioriparius]|uniref:Uncharacterized protein n=1 Tax=Miscanthus lutarioriparius TaxID=422564 RepID=A0A811MUP8_9POAL|nr:unnamed protein product [Miscanthus lutarioriparius]CAD6210841.1 unnamed protein product [Miscanthus lutarioriparius]